MGRDSLKLGEWGRINVLPFEYDAQGRLVRLPEGARKARLWRARAYVRDLDGTRRMVERSAPTKPAAVRALTDALRERVTPAQGKSDISATTRVRDVAEAWLIDLDESDRKTSTRQVYRTVCRLHVIGSKEHPSALANHQVREVTVGAVERFLTGIARTSGPGAAKTTRTVLRSVLDMATKHDAIPRNPVRDAGAVRVRTEKKGSREADRSFTPKELQTLRAFLSQDPKAARRDLPDLLTFLAGTGARIGEACALRWSSIDFEAGAAILGPVVVRERGTGLLIQDDGKTKTSTRIIKLPADILARLMARKVDAPGNDWDVVFPSPRNMLRDPSNTPHDVSETLTEAGFPWATAHTFRHTVATMLDQAGLSAREIANHLGHKRASMTQDVYMSRQTVSERAAELLSVD